MNSETVQTFLQTASEHYYKGTPIIPDEVFDELDNQEEVGAQEGDVPHAYQLFSLKKSYDESNIKLQNVVVTPKLDGACVALYFNENGEFYLAVTRGDGKKGKDVTDKLAKKHAFPVFKPNSQIIVEVVAPKTIKNARNYAAGALNLNSLDEFLERDIELVAHGVYPSPTGQYDKDLSLLENKLGLKTVLNDCDKYPQDGKVYRVNNDEAFRSLGYTQHHPRGAVALKERKEGVVSVLEAVEWQVGGSGKITPVAILSPIDIDGATVRRATLHNPEFIKALGLRIGDRVSVIRSGDIIPAIVKALKNDIAETNPLCYNMFSEVEIPSHCPSCNSPLVPSNTQLLCTNDACEARASMRLRKFAAVANIKGLGPATINKLGLETVEDIYKITESKASAVLGSKTAANLISELTKARVMDVPTALHAFSIPSIGLGSAKKLGALIKHPSEITAEICKKAGLGQVATSKLLNWMELEYPVKYKDLPITYVVDSKIKEGARKVCITGKLNDFPSRSLAKAHLESLGYEVVDSITKTTDYLVNESGESSSKTAKAAAYKIPTVTIKFLEENIK